MKLPKLSSPLKLFSPAPAQPALGMAGIGGNMMFASGGGGGDYDPDDLDQYDDFDEQAAEPERRPRATRSARSGGTANAGSGRGDTTGGRPRTTQFQPEERFWTDYLRIALPVIGLLLMIGLLWFWADRIINDDPGPTEPVSTEDVGLVTTSTPPPAEIQSTPPPANTDTAGTTTDPTPPAGDNQANTQETPPPAAETPTEPPADTGGAFASGDAVTVTEPVNLRPNPTTEGDALEVLDIGAILTITDGPIEGEGYTWWGVVTEDGTAGWIAEGEYLQPAE